MPGALLKVKYWSGGSSKDMLLFVLDSGPEFCLPRVAIFKRPPSRRKARIGHRSETQRRLHSKHSQRQERFFLSSFAITFWSREKWVADLAQPVGKR